MFHGYYSYFCVIPLCLTKCYFVVVTSNNHLQKISLVIRWGESMFSKHCFIDCYISSQNLVWFVSNCNQTNGAVERLKYAKEMIAAGLQLDGYGECFDRKLRSNLTTHVQTPWTVGGLISSYKFYLVFENAIHCNDYISEKLWRNALRTGAVPIVFGPHR